MTMQLLDASARLRETRGPKILIAGPTAIGKRVCFERCPRNCCQRRCSSTSRPGIFQWRI